MIMITLLLCKFYLLENLTVEEYTNRQFLFCDLCSVSLFTLTIIVIHIHLWVMAISVIAQIPVLSLKYEQSHIVPAYLTEL